MRFVGSYEACGVGRFDLHEPSDHPLPCWEYVVSLLLQYILVLRVQVGLLFHYESKKSFRFLLAESCNAIYASIPTPMISICTVITPSLYKRFHHR
jgi:hypothetical protein